MELRFCTDCGHLSAPGQTRCGRCGGSLRVDDARALIGHELGRYRLLEVIGVGGMGIVYLAEHLGLSRQVALKLLLPTLDDPGFVERFRREARLLATLEHRHIVAVLDFDVSPDGVPFYAMERLRGCTLAQALSGLGRPLALSEIVGVIGEVGSALAQAHAQRVVHRDLKPDNIFLALDGDVVVPKLLDFGIAKQLGQDDAAARLTGTGMVMGTPLYLTPEQLGGEEVGPATDQYALALIAAECLLGRPLRQGMSVTQILHGAMQESTLAPLSGLALPNALLDVLAKATAFSPAARFPDVASMTRALAELAAPEDRRWLAMVRNLANARMAAPEPEIAPTTPVPKSVSVPSPAGVSSQALPPTTATPQPQAAPTRSGRSRLLAFSVAIMALVGIALILGWRRESMPEPRSDREKPTDATSPRADLDLEVGLRIKLAPDAGRLLGIGQPGAVFATAAGIYQQALGANEPAVRQADAAEERWIGVVTNGGLLVQSRSALIERDPRGRGERKVGDLPKGTEHIRAVDALAQGFVADDGKRLHLVDTTKRIELTDLPRDRVQHVRLGRDAILAALANPAELRLLRRGDGALQWSSPISAIRLDDIAWDEYTGQIALCGFSPQVELFTVGAASGPQRIDVPVRCHAAHFLADGPSLVLRADHALLLWRNHALRRLDIDLPAADVDTIAPRFVEQGGSLWIGESDGGELIELRLLGATPEQLNRESLGELWDLAADADSVYAGAADGRLWQLRNGDAKSMHVHDAGITAILRRDDALATASDDRTIAVWHLPDLGLRWRTRGHEFLVNQLWLAPDASALWSSSSDGQLKRWRWPDLEPMDGIDIRKLSGQNLSLHALWLNAGQDEALLGSWNHQLVHLRRAATDWQLNALPVAGSGGYRMQEVATAKIVVVLTILPSRLYAFDLTRGTLLALPDADLTLLALAPGERSDTVFAAGDGVIMQFQFSRDADSNLVVKRVVRQLSTLKAISAASTQAESKHWLVASEGKVLRLPFSWLDTSVLEQR